MAARKRIVHDENTRAKIQTSQLINRLTNHILGKIKLSSTQVRAIEVLLKKTLPDLSAIEMKAEVTEKKVINAEPISPEEWESQYSLESSTGPTESTH